MINYYQQGDVLLFEETLPKTDLMELKTNIVEEGEATGHAHRLYGDGFTMLQNPKTKERYLKIVSGTPLRHEEHHEQVLPPGVWRIGKVREKGMFDDIVAPVVD